MENDHPFDPLIDLDGMWTVEVAERYLPIPGLPLVKYECWDGKLFMAPYEAARNSYGAIELAAALRQGAREAGHYIYGTVNLTMGALDRWIQPDLTVLDSPQSGTWAAAEHCVMPVEFISPTSRRRDQINKPAACAQVGIEWFMTVELDAARDLAVVELRRLVDGQYQLVTRAMSGQRFQMAEPFAADFDPADLLAR
ncbi:Uma2 family endonuclease [Catellatospora sp. NPDC049609]|uniref:Uma2 family endonuclease n=1 Tax=Catellatospora sp. NPDC049609 TaxID=3155505 RepID=UPI003427715E